MQLPCGRAAAYLLLVLVGLLWCLDVAAARPAPLAPTPPHQPPDDAAWHSFKHVQDARRGHSVAGLAELKRYLARFGYMHHKPDYDDAFDEHLEAAVKRYQSRLGLPVTGELDSATIARITSQRCGISDAHVGHAGLSASLSESAAGRFTFFEGEPRWTRLGGPLVLTYSVAPLPAAVNYLPDAAVRDAIRSAFARWARVIPVEFVEIIGEDDYYGEVDIKVGFYLGDHGDGAPFDGQDGVLAHAFAPKNGGLHFDAAEHWTVDVDRETISDPIDLESVATHEIGHVLGLGHSSSPEAVMYPYFDVRERRVELTIDDIEGVQLLYGSNPDFRHALSPVSMSPGRSSWFAGSVSLLCVVLTMLVMHF